MSKKATVNYDIARADIFNLIETNPGVSLNGLNEMVGDASTEKKYKFPVIYSCVRYLQDDGSIVADVRVKKNRGLYCKDVTLPDLPEKKQGASQVRASGKNREDKRYLVQKLENKAWKTIESTDDIDEATKWYSTSKRLVMGLKWRIWDKQENNLVDGYDEEAGAYMDAACASVEDETEDTTERSGEVACYIPDLEEAEEEEAVGAA